MSHGGKRQGAGRPLGSGKGRTKKRNQLSMSQEAWDKLDRLTDNRSAWVEAKIKNARESSGKKK